MSSCVLVFPSSLSLVFVNSLLFLLFSFSFSFLSYLNNFCLSSNISNSFSSRVFSNFSITISFSIIFSISPRFSFTNAESTCTLASTHTLFLKILVLLGVSVSLFFESIFNAMVLFCVFTFELFFEPTLAAFALFCVFEFEFELVRVLGVFNFVEGVCFFLAVCLDLSWLCCRCLSRILSLVLLIVNHDPQVVSLQLYFQPPLLREMLE
uniref:Uncharacterized protein n=1 Tax=Cacopsylla melanoneura TaxID=428564 RepID=A0A8D8W4I1_9HEMI